MDPGLIGFLLFLPGFIIFWCIISLFLSRISGWYKLSGRFSTLINPVGEKVWVGHAMLGVTSYKNVIKLTLNEQGMFINILFLFRPGHVPLFIPWQNVRVEKKKSLFRGPFTFYLGIPEYNVAFSPNKNVALKILAAAKVDPNQVA